MTKLYIVKASYGAYSDRGEDIVAAYESEALAAMHAKRGRAETNRMWRLQTGDRVSNRFGSGGWDLEFEVEEVDLLTEVPE